VDDLGFDFGSSFVIPRLKPELGKLGQMVAAHPRSPLSIFGHADPTGGEEFNKRLSGRRALAVYALLTRKVEIRNELFTNPLGDDQWNPRAMDMMRRALGDSSAARPKIFRDYMDWLCGSFQLSPKDFLAQGADFGGKGDWQGCGEFNPALLLLGVAGTAWLKITGAARRKGGKLCCLTYTIAGPGAGSGLHGGGARRF
jgi:hypothetical protein